MVLLLLNLVDFLALPLVPKNRTEGGGVGSAWCCSQLLHEHPFSHVFELFYASFSYKITPIFITTHLLLFHFYQWSVYKVGCNKLVAFWQVTILSWFLQPSIYPEVS